MAAFSSNRVHGLIDRLFYHSPHRTSHAVTSTPSRLEAGIRNLQRVPATSGEEIDNNWLRRIELRSSAEVAEFLERAGFPERHGLLAALFVDKRCGFVASQIIRSAISLEPDELIRSILNFASSRHAHGIILATNDLPETFCQSGAWQELITKLCWKGEAIDIFLLDHVVRTARGWKAAFPKGAAGAPTCS